MSFMLPGSPTAREIRDDDDRASASANTEGCTCGHRNGDLLARPHHVGSRFIACRGERRVLATVWTRYPLVRRVQSGLRLTFATANKRLRGRWSSFNRTITRAQIAAVLRYRNRNA
jgi:hypothetical protein